MNQWLYGILIGLAVKSCIFPGWQSSSEFAFFCGLLALVTYLDVKKVPDASQALKKLEEDLQELREQTASGRHEFTALKMKLGLGRTGT